MKHFTLKIYHHVKWPWVNMTFSYLCAALEVGVREGSRSLQELLDMVPTTTPLTLVSTAPIHHHAERNTRIQHRKTDLIYQNHQSWSNVTLIWPDKVLIPSPALQEDEKMSYINFRKLRTQNPYFWDHVEQVSKCLVMLTLYISTFVHTATFQVNRLTSPQWHYHRSYVLDKIE